MNCCRPILAMLLVPFASLFAQLQWDKTVLEFTPEYGEAMVEGTYTFRNVGKAPITIEQVQPSCGCTTVTLDKRTYAPGEFGSIPVRMSIEPSGGERRKTIYVRTDEKEPATNSYLLTIASTTRELARLSNRLFVWMNNEAAEGRTVTVDILGDQPIRIARAFSSSDAFRVDLSPAPTGRSYAVKITPLTTERAVSARITIQLDYPAGHPAEYYVYARVAGASGTIHPAAAGN